MRLSRRPRLVATLLALISVLFTQLAVAAYACPSMQIAQAMESIAISATAIDHQNMAGCEEMEMDREAPVLCQNHGQTGHQSLDKPEVPDVLPFTATLLMQSLSVAASSYQSVAPPAENIFLKRTTAPPLSIQNCCFRI